MKISLAARLALAGAVVVMAAACAGGSQVAGTSPVPGSAAIGANAGASFVSASGRLFRHGGADIRRALVHPSRGYSKGPKDLFVALLTNVAVLQNKTWQQLGTIGAAGMSCPDEDWVDNRGNVYVADWDCGGSNTPGVYEFPPGASTPSMVYTTGLTDPVDVETDKHGNVYIMDFFGGYLDEYAQGSNTLLYQCAPPSGYGLVGSAAIDKHGNVFMASVNNQAPWTAYLYEYAGGLKGCPATQLATFPFFPGGMVLDKKQNLLLVDQVDDVVDVIPPPYTAIGSQIAAYDAFTVTINRQNNRIYIANYPDGSDGNTGAVYVDAYPGGSNLATLGASNGISYPSGAADTSNYIP